MTASRLLASTGFLLLLPLVGCDSDKEIKVYQVPKDVNATKAAAGDPHAGVPMPSPGKDPHAGVTMPAPGVKNPHEGMTNAAGKPRVEGQVPTNWETGRGSSMRLASYLAKGDGKALADISLVAMGGQAGGLLPNINRWRAQIGLDPVDEQGLEKSSQKVMTPLGEAVLVDLISTGQQANAAQDGRIIAAILALETEMWFYKMRGNTDVVGREKEAFIQWIKTAKKKEPSAQPPAEPQIPATPAVPAAPAAPPAGVTWKVPDGWQTSGSTSEMRLASFTATAKDGKKAAVTVVRLGGAGGGELANVNRWRKQIDLDPIDAQAFAQSTKVVNSVSGPISVVDCKGGANQTLAGWCRNGNSTWFFKLTGPTSVVEAERAHYMSFLTSIEFSAP